MKMDLIGDSDPFCNLSLGCQHWQSTVCCQQSMYIDKDPNVQVVKRSLEPVWREDWEVVVENAMLMDHTLDLEMWDKVGEEIASWV